MHRDGGSVVFGIVESKVEGLKVEGRAGALIVGASSITKNQEQGTKNKRSLQLLLKIVFGSEGEDELFEQLDGVLDVIEVSGFDDGMHAAEGE